MSDEVDNPDLISGYSVSPTDRSSDRAQSDADQVITSDKLDQLITSSQNLTIAAQLGLEREATSKRRFRATMTILGISTITVLIALLVVVSKMNDSLNSAATSRAQLADCIKPTGQCYKDGQKRTGEAIGTVDKLIILAATCAPDFVQEPIPQRYIDIQNCIATRLNK